MTSETRHIDDLLPRDYIVEWLRTKVVKKIGSVNKPNRTERLKPLSGAFIAKQFGVGARYIRSIAAGKRNLPTSMHRILSGLIRDIESGKIVVEGEFKCARIVKQKTPKPRRTWGVSIDANGVKIEARETTPPARRLPSFPEAFRKR